MDDYLSINLIDHAKHLFPICRSLTGEGVRKTLDYFEYFHKELKRFRIRTGEKVYDWEIPLEWNIKDAYIENLETGKRYAEFKKNNLHVVGYSEPINLELNLTKLSEKIYTLNYQEDWIPYITSYYKKDWGFCLSEQEKNKLPEGNYKVLIDSSLKEGFLEYSSALIKGKSKKEILFTSYICHPSMANNEISGPVVLNAILDYIKKEYKSPIYSYRFALTPETIGSIAYIKKFEKQLRKNVICGFNLSCVGDERGYSFVQTPYNNTIADSALRASLIGKENAKEYTYLDRGSDERQYCSPGVELPLCTFCKSKFGEYPEYHTSADNFDLVTDKGLNDSFELMKTIVDCFELGLKPSLIEKCEPQLGKRDLYPSISIKSNGRRPAQTRTDILAYCNGKNSIFDVANIIGIELKTVIREISLLKRNNIIRG